MQIRIDLPLAAHLALMTLSAKERRGARDQAAVLVVEGLARRRLVGRDGLALAEDATSRSANRLVTAAVAGESR